MLDFSHQVCRFSDGTISDRTFPDRTSSVAAAFGSIGRWKWLSVLIVLSYCAAISQLCAGRTDSHAHRNKDRGSPLQGYPRT